MGMRKQRPVAVALDPKQEAWRFPVQQELEGLFGKLSEFNDRIAELTKDEHQSLAVNVLNAQALSLARHIDELRCFLVVPKR
jgi:hypothetical protein